MKTSLYIHLVWSLTNESMLGTLDTGMYLVLRLEEEFKECVDKIVQFADKCGHRPDFQGIFGI
jgi:hypothetical protein